MLSGGGCLMLPTGLGGAVARGFALLDASTNFIRRSSSSSWSQFNEESGD